MTKKVRLSYELSAVQHAIQGAQFLAMLLRDDGMPSPEYAQATPAALAGVLMLAEARLRLVCRILEGEVNPAAIHALHNAAEDELDYEEGVVLQGRPEKSTPSSEEEPPATPRKRRLLQWRGLTIRASESVSKGAEAPFNLPKSTRPGPNRW